jgi:hypothetical protein
MVALNLAVTGFEGTVAEGCARLLAAVKGFMS